MSPPERTTGPLEAATLAYLTPPPRLKKDGTPYKTRKAKHVTEDDAFCRMVMRMLDRLERRGIENPAILSFVLRVQRRADEMANVIAATNAERNRTDPMLGPGIREMARWLDIKSSSMQGRVNVGRAIIATREAAAGVTRLTPAQRERHAVQEAAAAVGVVSLAEYRAKHRKAS